PRLEGELPLPIEQRRGAARDRYGNWYWIAESQSELRFLSSKPNATAEHFWSAADQVYNCTAPGEFFAATAPQAPSELLFSGLAVTPDHYLVVGMLEVSGLLVFDLYSGGPPSRLVWPSGIPFAPFDMAVTADRGIAILDRVNKAYWKLDSQLRVQNIGPANLAQSDTGFFEPVIPEPAGVPAPLRPCIESERISLEFAVPLNSVSDPIAIAAMSDGSILILDNPPGKCFSVIHRYVGGLEMGPSLKLDKALAEFVPEAPTDDPCLQAVRAYDFAFTTTSKVPNAIGTLYIAQIIGDQAFAFDVTVTANSLTLAVQPRYYPLRRFEGKGIVAADGNAYYDFQESWVQVTEQPRPQYQVRSQLQLPQSPVPASPSAPPTAFDGKQPACVWHRLFLDACIPPGGSVQVESRAVDLQSLLPSTPWQLEPKLYLRANGPELPYFTAQLQGAADRVGTWELLFQNARGRYLQLRLTLTGNGRTSPRLQAMRIYYPRFSYLRQYLPAVYQDDPVSAHFIDRYLANVEGFFTVLEGQIADVQELFDPRVIPSDYLDWLASWVSIALDPSWSDQTRRLVLQHVPQMLRERGTPAGIVRAIRLMLDTAPDESLFQEQDGGYNTCTNTSDIFSVRIVESFLTRLSPNVDTGSTSEPQGPDVVAAAAQSECADNPSWTPAQGPAPLNALYRCYLQSNYTTIAALNAAWQTKYTAFDDSALVLPPVQPTSSVQAQDWSNFLRDGLGFTYAPVTSADQGAYQTLLSQIYSTIGDLNTAWNLSGANVYSSFDSVALPSMMPSGQQLVDWIKLVSIALPAQQNAHRFTVLVPVSLTDTTDTQSTKLAVAQRIAKIQKPAHTAFDVKLYWAMFCAGEARLGQDTLLGLGSRFAALVLGQGGLGASNLASANPILARDRQPPAARSLLQTCCEVIPQERCI
ncbi:MAG TPA: phage tail protein, partial [Silvibacterium sp.]|nr:phage tail protein [Silvibacterium sp.]